MRYPDDPRPKAPYVFRTNRPFVSGGPPWATQDRPLTRFGLGEADLDYGALTWDEVKTLYDFFESVGGPGGRFTYVDFNGIDEGGRPWTSLFVAKADAVTISWDLPTYALVNPRGAPNIIFENNVAKTHAFITTTPDLTKVYNIKIGGGTDGVDLLTATAALTTVATAPSPATTGTSLVVATGHGANFPATPFYANVWPTGVVPVGPDDSLGRAANIETVQVTTVATDTLTIVRGYPARTIIVGDQIAVPPPATSLITISGTCRRAFRRARFTAPLSPFSFDVPELYAAGPTTVAEVRR